MTEAIAIADKKMLVRGVRLRKVFESGVISKRRVVAVDNVDIEIGSGETLALVGESGSGKSTLGRMLLLLIRPTSGDVYFDGMNLTKMKESELRKIRQKMQLIPQHPESALDPRWRIYNSIAEPLRIHKLADRNEEKEIVYRLIETVGLQEEHLSRYPHELSGGELQRAVIARAIALNPKFIVCDEPTSMLDVSVQAAIINLLMNLQRRLGLSYLFITHDLEVANTIAHRIAVMYAGQIVEEGVRILDGPLHPYTRMLVESLDMNVDSKNFKFKAEDLLNTHSSKQTGCKFYHLCPKRMDKCLKPPEIVEIDGRRVRCHLY
ncbi:ABC transporter ATP-binding protein [Archaeoglobus veneficus]|uniref:Nickel-transporting ATPase n=1 Tax=Archaeoglobus veneficus (strain DSM 11195 / SNP6) TaxID=693661 RepID=F2KQ38_ARCVS|nr:ABC transporter ATP-binding protein [Archaeoglobus veneficus]AEA47641.1 Nickel-transporting ATPase [Archaeoglobus veneficus SNP6]